MEAGEIITIGGLKDIQIGETLADVDTPVALPVIKVQQPTVQMTFGVNTSLFQVRKENGAPRATLGAPAG